MRDNPSLSVQLSVHGNGQYEAVVLERIAKFEALCQKLQAEQSAATGVEEEVKVDEDVNLLDSEERAPGTGLIETDFLLPQSVFNGLAPDKATGEEEESPVETDACNIISLVDVQRESTFAFATADPTEIRVQNLETGNSELNLFSISGLQPNYF